MQTAQILKEKLQLNTDLAELLDILRGIAVSEFWALEKKKVRFKKFTEAFSGFFEILDFSRVEHPFTKGTGKLGIIMVTSDEGFMGGLNERVISGALEIPGAKDARLMIIGEQGAGYLNASGHSFIGLPSVNWSQFVQSVNKLKDQIIQEVLFGQLGELILVYPRPVTFMVQAVEKLKILPCTKLFNVQEKIKHFPVVNKNRKLSQSDFLESESILKDGSQKNEESKKGFMDSLRRSKIVSLLKEEVIVESDMVHVVEYLMETWITEKLLEVFEDSKLAELASRTIHLEESYQRMLETGSQIKQKYFRARRELIDKGMRDSFSAQIVRGRGSGLFNSNNY